jgi:glycosyltransferase involved in cell wall biosynthesis
MSILSSTSLVPLISVCIITYDEEANIEKCLRSLEGNFGDVWVVDSCSTDKTVAIAASLNANVRQHEFADWASQRNWALDNVPFGAEWILFLDADEEMNGQAWCELRQLVAEADDDLAGITIRRRLYFLGRELRWSYDHPPIVRIVRKARVRWSGAGAREYAAPVGRTQMLRTYLGHHDARGLSHWLYKHVQNAQREALHELEELPQGRKIREIQPGQRVRLFVRNTVWRRMPEVGRCFAYFVYRYVFRLGFLEGRSGFLFCFYHALWYPLTITALKTEKATKMKIEVPGNH